MNTFVVVVLCVVSACVCVVLAVISVQVRELVRTVNALADERLYAPFLAALRVSYTDEPSGSWSSALRHRRRDEDQGDEDADDEHQAADRDQPPEARPVAAEDTGRHRLVGTQP